MEFLFPFGSGVTGDYVEGIKGVGGAVVEALAGDFGVLPDGLLRIEGGWERIFYAKNYNKETKKRRGVSRQADTTNRADRTDEMDESDTPRVLPLGRSRRTIVMNGACLVIQILFIC